MKNKILCILLATVFAVNGAPASGVDYSWYDNAGLNVTDYSGKPDSLYNRLINICIGGADYKEATEYYFEEPDDGSMEMIMPEKVVNAFKNKENKLIKIKFTPIDYCRYYDFLKDQPRDDRGVFYLFTDDYRLVKKVYHMDERSIYSVKEILSDSEIDKSQRIVYATYSMLDFYSDVNKIECCDCVPGWNTIDGEKYYVKADGALATKSMTIGGIRYKFGKNGVCAGKYTGWTESAKGRRYWKDGELQKNTEVTTKSGKTYTLDKNGYAKLKRQSA